MADIDALVRIYLRLARIETGSDQPSAHITWLSAKFAAVAARQETDDAVVASRSFEGSSMSLVYRGTTALERAEALDQALAQLESQVSGAKTACIYRVQFDSRRIPR